MDTRRKLVGLVLQRVGGRQRNSAERTYAHKVTRDDVGARAGTGRRCGYAV
jgi:hypothetical protein